MSCSPHRPQFGVLDECTSAVSIDAEEELYKAAIGMGITPVTISQRLSLPEFHAADLRMGENNADGNTLVAIDAESTRLANERDGRDAAKVAEAAALKAMYISRPEDWNKE
jgi:ATP-binding cassette subfamily D (ALD) long-chain fatty acid import protein